MSEQFPQSGLDGMDESERFHREQGERWRKAESDAKEAEAGLDRLAESNPELRSLWSTYKAAQKVLEERPGQ